jgi:hypothetical protein
MSPPASSKSEKRPRRSKRIGLSVPVRVYGKDAHGKPFREFTQMLSVNAHGGMLALAAVVNEGQAVLVQNRATGQERECRVTHLRLASDGKWEVGIAFMHAAEGFWQICFPSIASK